MDFEDDLPPPKPKAPIVLDDSDDDIPPPPAAPAPSKGIPINLDDDDDLPPPPPGRPPANAPPAADDFDEDLPPPPPAAKAAPQPPPVAASPTQTAAAQATPSKSTVSFASPAPTKADSASPASPSTVATRKRGMSVRVTVYREGYLLKQQPNWPYSSQKRWCVLDGRKFSYFESQESTTKALGTLDMKGARLNLQLGDAGKMPNSFGLVVDLDPHAGENALSKVLTLGGVLGGPSQEPKGRTFIFSTLTRDDYEDWTKTILSVTSEKRAMELHWFEKMAQGIF
jgi:hypothetical protein